MAPQRENRVKVSTLLHAGHKVSEVANRVGVSCTAVYVIKKSWTMAKVSIDVQAVVERLLWTVTACGMPFEALLRIICVYNFLFALIKYGYRLITCM